MYRTLMAEREGLIVILEMLELRNGLRYTLSTHSAEQEVIAAAAGGGGRAHGHTAVQCRRAGARGACVLATSYQLLPDTPMF